MTLKWTPEGYPENDTGCLSGPKKTKEKGSTNGSTFTPLYNGIEDSYGVDSIGYCWVIGVLKGNTTPVGVTISPKITAFDNVDGYDGMVFEGNIKLNSFCSHHHLPFIGTANVAYIPSKEGKTEKILNTYTMSQI